MNFIKPPQNEEIVKYVYTIFSVKYRSGLKKIIIIVIIFDLECCANA